MRSPSGDGGSGAQEEDLAVRAHRPEHEHLAREPGDPPRREVENGHDLPAHEGLAVRVGDRQLGRADFAPRPPGRSRSAGDRTAFALGERLCRDDPPDAHLDPLELLDVDHRRRVPERGRTGAAMHWALGGTIEPVGRADAAAYGSQAEPPAHAPAVSSDRRRCDLLELAPGSRADGDAGVSGPRDGARSSPRSSCIPPIRESSAGSRRMGSGSPISWPRRTSCDCGARAPARSTR